jgi:hypothetical protein
VCSSDLKYIQTLESFKKTYGQKISQADFKKISVGKEVLYMGSRYEVISNDGYVLKLKNEKGDEVSANLGQFNHGGQINETLINEGQFSWMTQDTGNQIGSERQNTITVYMFDNKGTKWKEASYDGYGEFGGKDYYELLAQMNGIENADRQDGIDIAFGKKKVKGKVLFPALVEDPRFNWKRHDFTKEPENDPNQSWYQEEEYDDYNESVVSEGEVLVFDEIGTELESLQKKIRELMKKATDKKWISTLGAASSALSGLDMKLSQADSKLGAIITESGVNEAARVPSNIMDFAKRKGSYATSLVKKAATWAEKAGKYISGGTAIGKNYDTIILDMKHQGSEIYINLNDETIELFGEPVTNPKSFAMVLAANESLMVNESSMSLTQYYKNSDKSVKEVAKQIDTIIDTAKFTQSSGKDKLLWLITDLTDAYLADMRDE